MCVGESDLCYKNVRHDHNCTLGLFFWDKDLPLKPVSSCRRCCFSSLLWYFDRYITQNRPLYRRRRKLHASCCGLKVPVVHLQQYYSDKFHLQSHIFRYITLCRAQCWFMAHTRQPAWCLFLQELFFFFISVEILDKKGLDDSL